MLNGTVIPFETAKQREQRLWDELRIAKLRQLHADTEENRTALDAAHARFVAHENRLWRWQILRQAAVGE